MSSETRLSRWLEWARQIQALAQTGLHYALNDFQRQRYLRLQEIAAEMVSEHSDVPFQSLAQIYKEQIGYATPRLDVRGAVIQDGRLLMVRERADGGWTMPGGWADVGDMPSLAVEREVYEESGLQVRAYRLVGVYDANRVAPLEVFHSYKLVFLCQVLGGELAVSDETCEAAFFSPQEIPQDLSGNRTTPRTIGDAFRAYEDASWNSVFD